MKLPPFRRAFTLLELVVAFVIMAMMAAIAIPTFTAMTRQHSSAGAAATPGATDMYLFILLAGGAVVALCVMGLWARWHLLRHKAKTNSKADVTDNSAIAVSSSGPVINTSSTPARPGKPGWYSNPESPGDARWWDGKQWVNLSENDARIPAAAQH